MHELGQRIEVVVREALGKRIKPVEQRPFLSDASLAEWCATLAQIAIEPGGPTEPFRTIGSKRAIQELRRAARYRKAGRSLPPFHETSIRALAAVGRGREAFSASTAEARAAADAAIRYLELGISPVGPIDRKPTDGRARGFVAILAFVYEGATALNAHHNATPFLDLLEQVARVVPALRIDSEHHVRAVYEVARHRSKMSE